MTIETENLKLIPGNPAVLIAALTGDTMLADLLKVKVAEQWTAFGPAPLEYALKKMKEDGNENGWWTYFPVHKADNAIIGSGGYKGRPTGKGIVEIGYEIAPAYRNRGLAGEMTLGLISHAWKDSRVTAITAHTLGHENPSCSVLRKCGFNKVEELNDPQDGIIWKWEMKRT